MVLSSRGELMKNALIYAYIGDSIYECYIRKYLISKNFTKLKDLQHESLNYVSAVSQRKHLELLEQENFLTQEELDIVKWGRNAHGGKSKAADIVTYRLATGLECLIGYLYYQNKQDRIKEIMERITSHESIW